MIGPIMALVVIGLLFVAEFIGQAKEDKRSKK